MIRHHSLVCRCGIADFIVFKVIRRVVADADLKSMFLDSALSSVSSQHQSTKSVINRFLRTVVSNLFKLLYHPFCYIF